MVDAGKHKGVKRAGKQGKDPDEIEKNKRQYNRVMIKESVCFYSSLALS